MTKRQYQRNGLLLRLREDNARLVQENIQLQEREQNAITHAQRERKKTQEIDSMMQHLAPVVTRKADPYGHTTIFEAQTPDGRYHVLAQVSDAIIFHRQYENDIDEEIKFRYWRELLKLVERQYSGMRMPDDMFTFSTFPGGQ